ncbi:histidine phosphatase family protein [Burkholderia sp. Cy-647]|nr:histidine phosphatase family protein [Burkholderia sp. Tr-860]NIF62987.1 histidine phosphatase family protein [Burkholderia sp. Cy-647]NIF95061.1 histidine phosphatase family protein [Burkholderia sp. Ax-1720]
MSAPKPVLRVACIRHGESAANAGSATDDPASIPLTEAGQQQAFAISRRLTSPPNLIICSPFDRAQQTAAPTLRRFPHTPRETWPIQEFTYLTPAKCAGTSAAQRRPWVEAYWDSHCSRTGYRCTASYTGRDAWELNDQHIDCPCQSQQAERISQRIVDC